MSANRILPEGFPEDWLSAYLDNQLSRSRCRQVEAALAMNPELAEMLEELKASKLLVKQLPACPTADMRFTNFNFEVGNLGRTDDLYQDLEDGLESTLAKPITPYRSHSMNPQSMAQGLTVAAGQEQTVHEAPVLPTPEATSPAVGSPSHSNESPETEDTVDLDKDDSIGVGFDPENTQTPTPAQEAAIVESPRYNDLQTIQQKATSAEARDGDSSLINITDELEESADQASSNGQALGMLESAELFAEPSTLRHRNFKPLAIAAGMVGILLTGSVLWQLSKQDESELSMNRPISHQEKEGDPRQAAASSPSAIPLDKDLPSELGNVEPFTAPTTAPTTAPLAAKSRSVESMAQQAQQGEFQMADPIFEESPSSRSLLTEPSAAEQLPSEQLPSEQLPSEPAALAAKGSDTLLPEPTESTPEILDTSEAIGQSESLADIADTASNASGGELTQLDADAMAAAPTTLDATANAIEEAQHDSKSAGNSLEEPNPPTVIEQQFNYQLPPNGEVGWHRSHRWSPQAALEQVRGNSLLAPLRRGLRSSDPAIAPRQEPSGASNNSGSENSIPIAVYRMPTEQAAQVARRAQSLQLEPAWDHHARAKSRFLFLSEAERQQLFPPADSDSSGEIFWVKPTEQAATTDLRIIILNTE